MNYLVKIFFVLFFLLVLSACGKPGETSPSKVTGQCSPELELWVKHVFDELAPLDQTSEALYSVKSETEADNSCFLKTLPMLPVSVSQCNDSLLVTESLTVYKVENGAASVLVNGTFGHDSFFNGFFLVQACHYTVNNGSVRNVNDNGGGW